MTDQTCTVNGHRATRLTLRAPRAGAWSAIVDFDSKLDAALLAGAAVVRIGESEFVGTFASDLTGSYQLQSRAFLLGGAGAWRTQVAAKHYHSDSGVRAKTVVADLVTETGETLGGTAYDAVLGGDFVRHASSAGDALRRVLGSTPWWVAYDGTTRIGARVDAEVDAKYEVLEYDPRWHLASVAVDDVQAVLPGSILRNRLESAVRVRDLEIVVEPGSVRLLCYCQDYDATGSEESRFARDFGLAVRAVVPELPFFGRYRYRVVMANPGDYRYHLQAISLAIGLPDLLPVSVSPGTPGLGATLYLGSIVHLQFLDGDPRYPVVVGHPPRDDEGWKPDELTLDAEDTVTIGASASSVLLGPTTRKVVARKDDVVVCGGFGGTITTCLSKVEAG